MINGEKIGIRTIREQDLERLFELVNDIEDRGHYLDSSLVSESKFKSQFAKDGFVSDKVQRYLIVHNSSEIVGSIWSFESVPYYDAIEIGFHIFGRKNRRKGYATEALELFHSYVFESKEINRIELRIATENLASEVIAKKVGFKLEGTSREAAFSKGRLHDMHLYAKLRKEWQANK